MPRYTRPDISAFYAHPGVLGAVDTLQAALGPALIAAGVSNANREYYCQAPQPGLEGVAAGSSSRIDVFQRTKDVAGNPTYLGSFDAVRGGTAVAPTVTLSNYRAYSIPSVGAPQWLGLPQTNVNDAAGAASLPTIGSW